MPRRVPNRINLRSMLTTPNMVKAELAELKPDKATGPDQIPAILLNTVPVR